jgi:DNA-binding XRE family transcriptional regulator
VDFRIVKKAEITQGEFARLVGVHRVTVNKWMSGKIKPHRLIEARVAEILGHLGEALKRRDLPLPPQFNASIRAAFLRRHARLGNN